MVQARPRSSQQSSAPVTAKTLRTTGTSAARRSSVRPPAPSAESSPVPAKEEAHSDAAADAMPGRREGEDASSVRLPRAATAGASLPPSSTAENVAESLSAPPLPSGVPQASSSGAKRAEAEGARAEGADRDSRSEAGVEGGAGMTGGERNSGREALDGLSGQAGDRETMVYQGSVRSGQQVGGAGGSVFSWLRALPGVTLLLFRYRRCCCCCLCLCFVLCWYPYCHSCCRCCCRSCCCSSFLLLLLLFVLVSLFVLGCLLYAIEASNGSHPLAHGAVDIRQIAPAKDSISSLQR